MLIFQFVCLYFLLGWSPDFQPSGISDWKPTFILFLKFNHDSISILGLFRNLLNRLFTLLNELSFYWVLLSQMSNPIGEKSGLILNGNKLVSSKRVRITFSHFWLDCFKIFRRRLEWERGTLSVLLKISFIYLLNFFQSNCCLNWMMNIWD